MLRGYQSAAPHLILWGCVYADTYAFAYFQPSKSGLAWLIVVPLAIIGDMAIALRDRVDRRVWTVVLVPIVAFLALILATITIMRPYDPRQMSMAVVGGGTLVLSGLWLRRRDHGSVEGHTRRSDPPVVSVSHHGHAECAAGR